MLLCHAELQMVRDAEMCVEARCLSNNLFWLPCRGAGLAKPRLRGYFASLKVINLCSGGDLHYCGNYLSQIFISTCLSYSVNQAQAQQSYAAPELLILFLFLLSGYRQHCRAGKEGYCGNRYRCAGLRGQRSFSAAVCRAAGRIFLA